MMFITSYLLYEAVKIVRFGQPDTDCATHGPHERRTEMLEQGFRNPAFGADKFGFKNLTAIYWNLLEPALYEFALTGGEAALTSGGALCAETGVHTGRSPKDKYI